METKRITNALLSFMMIGAAFTAASCSDDNDNDSTKGTDYGALREVTLTAAVGNNNNEKANAPRKIMKVGIKMEKADTVSFYWHKGDEIFVQTATENADNFSNGRKFSTADADGSDQASFSGMVEEKLAVNKYALSPYNEKHKFSEKDENQFTYNLPDKYTYTTVDSIVFPTEAGGKTAYPVNRSNMPMLGTISKEEGTVKFVHIGGVAIIRIDKMPAAEGTITVTADQKLSGDFTCADAASDPKITTAAATTDGEKTVTFSFKGAKPNSPGAFYLPLATGDYTNIKIGVNSGSVNKTIDYGSLTMQKALVIGIPIFNRDGNLYYLSSEGKFNINGHKFIDLGLPSGTLWAECNVGAASATEAGDYFAWGETEPKESYSSNNYKWSNDECLSFTKYDEEGLTLEPEDDVARVKWGAPCCMPAWDNFQELVENCLWYYENKDGIRVWKLVSTKNGNYIYLPAVGAKQDKEGYNGHDAYYWVNSEGKVLGSGMGDCLWGEPIMKAQRYIMLRSCGLSVRPVAKL